MPVIDIVKMSKLSSVILFSIASWSDYSAWRLLFLGLEIRVNINKKLVDAKLHTFIGQYK